MFAGASWVRRESARILRPSSDGFTSTSPRNGALNSIKRTISQPFELSHSFRIITVAGFPCPATMKAEGVSSKFACVRTAASAQRRDFRFSSCTRTRVSPQVAPKREETTS